MKNEYTVVKIMKKLKSKGWKEGDATYCQAQVSMIVCVETASSDHASPVLFKSQILFKSQSFELVL